MFFYLVSCITSSVVAFLYPGYASYKTLAQRPASERDIERWLMYWSVLGCIVGVEYVAEWLISWIPMYYLIKTLFLLYLVLPQTQGSSYLYTHHLQPFFRSHESQIDATLASFKARLYSFVRKRFRAIWEQLAGALGQPTQTQSGGGLASAVNSGAPPSLADPASGPAQLVMGLWRSYGPGIMASSAAFFHQGPPSVEDHARDVNKHQHQHQHLHLKSSSRNSSDSELRERGTASRFEEVDVPSDTEGYDVGAGNRTSTASDATRRTSWLDWRSSQASSARD